MIIHDPEGLIPDHDILRCVLSSHPSDHDLAGRVRSLAIFRSESYGSPRKMVDVDEAGNIKLGVGCCTHEMRNYRFILYHEFGHVADILRPAFLYSAAVRSSLSPPQAVCLMEVWNCYINARLHQSGLYEHGGIPYVKPHARRGRCTIVRVSGAWRRSRLTAGGLKTRSMLHAGAVRSAPFRAYTVDSRAAAPDIRVIRAIRGFL